MNVSDGALTFDIIVFTDDAAAAKQEAEGVLDRLQQQLGNLAIQEQGFNEALEAKPGHS